MVGRPSVQAPSAVVMIRPHHFAVNTETSDNAFQMAGSESDNIAEQARAEFDLAVDYLQSHGVRVHVFEGEDERTPDCVFPNNWFSTHPGGHVAIYPMMARNRRLERRSDVIDMLKRDYRVQDVIDYSGLEQDDLFLEGTGAMVIDHGDRVAYAVESNRTSPVLLERFCAHFNYEPMAFAATDGNGSPIYHTNVLMCIATDFALVGTPMIVDPNRRKEVVQRLAHHGREIIELDEAQISAYAGNAIELQGGEGRLLVLSEMAMRALAREQIAIIEKTTEIVPLRIPTIELAGGSARCMIAGIHLTKR